MKGQIRYLICNFFYRKRFYSFKKCLLETLEYFKNKEKYEEKGIRLTRTLHSYINNNYNHDRLPLISSKNIKNMLEEYKKLNNVNIEYICDIDIEY